MEYKVRVMISNRHVHLTKETYELLFDEELTIKKELNIKGQFAANQTVTIRNGEKVFENVRIVGPFRKYNQVEVSMHDARYLGLTPPVRRSGELEDALDITIETPKGSVVVKALIIADRHVHMSTEEASNLGFKDQEKVSLVIGGTKAGVLSAEMKISDDGVFEAHLDTDDANAFLLNSEDEITLIKE